MSQVLLDRKDTYSLRGICILGIILHHIYCIGTESYGISFPLVFDVTLRYTGYLASGVFFFLSGFGVYCSLQRKELTPKYVFQHLLKLYLPFLFIFILDLFVTVLLGQFDITKSILRMASLSLARGGTLWFMKVIFVLYIITFGVFYIFKDSRFRVSIVSLIVLMYTIFGIVCIGYTNDFWYKSVLCFPIGMIVAWKYAEITKANYKMDLLINLLFFAISVSLSAKYPNTLFGELLIMVSSVCFSFLSIFIVYYINVTNKFFDYCGKNSLCLYLFHLPFLVTSGLIGSFAGFALAVLGGVFMLTFIYKFFYNKCLFHLFD